MRSVHVRSATSTDRQRHPHGRFYPFQPDPIHDRMHDPRNPYAVTSTRKDPLPRPTRLHQTDRKRVPLRARRAIGDTTIEVR
jgi:hypothetical protein